MPQDFNSRVISTLVETYTCSYLHHNNFFQFVQKLVHVTLSSYVEHAYSGVCSWYTSTPMTKLMVDHRPRHFLPSLHKNPTLSQLCHKKKRTAVKMNPEQKENNDADSTYKSTSHCIGQNRHYIAKEKKYGEWKAIDCSRTLIGKWCYFICYLQDVEIYTDLLMHNTEPNELSRWCAHT